MLYSFLHVVLKALAVFYFRLQTDGIENIPKSGGVILAPNHPSDLDSIILGTAINRQLHTMGKEELFRRKFAAFILKKINAFPVKREKFDRASLRCALKILKDGNVIDMYPEGTVSKDGTLQEPKLGTAFIALQSKTPVIPVAIIGSYSVMSKGMRFPRPRKVVVKFGEPIFFDEYYDKPHKKEILKILSTRIMGEIKYLQESEGEAK